MFNWRKINAGIAANCLRYPRHIVSDEDMKNIRSMTDVKDVAEAILLRGGPFTERDIEILVDAAGNMEGYDFEKDGDNWDDDVLNKYAEYIQNYEYTYKPEAKNVDPDIDPNEKHIGPMAQDIEKVNPACIKETPEGIKTVDTGRLALMNAGAIADLAREVRDIKNG